MKNDTRQYLWETRLGYKMTNPQWSWCAVNHEQRRVIFQSWVHKMLNGQYLLLSEKWLDDIHARNSTTAAYNDACKAITLLEQGYQLCVTPAHVVDANVLPHKTKSINTQSYFMCSWVKIDTEWYAIPHTRLSC